MNVGGGYQPPNPNVSAFLSALGHGFAPAQQAPPQNPLSQALMAFLGQLRQPAAQSQVVSGFGSRAPFDIGGETRNPDGGLYLAPPMPGQGSYDVGGQQMQVPRAAPHTVHIQYPNPNPNPSRLHMLMQYLGH